MRFFAQVLIAPIALGSRIWSDRLEGLVLEYEASHSPITEKNLSPNSRESPENKFFKGSYPCLVTSFLYQRYNGEVKGGKTGSKQDLGICQTDA